MIRYTRQPLRLWSQDINSFREALRGIRVGQVRLHKHGYKIKVIAEGEEIFNGKKTEQPLFKFYELDADRRCTWQETGIWVLDLAKEIVE